MNTSDDKKTPEAFNPLDISTSGDDDMGFDSSEEDFAADFAADPDFAAPDMASAKKGGGSKFLLILLFLLLLGGGGGYYYLIEMGGDLSALPIPEAVKTAVAPVVAPSSPIVPVADPVPASPSASDQNLSADTQLPDIDDMLAPPMPDTAPLPEVAAAEKTALPVTSSDENKDDFDLAFEGFEEGETPAAPAMDMPVMAGGETVAETVVEDSIPPSVMPDDMMEEEISMAPVLPDEADTEALMPAPPLEPVPLPETDPFSGEDIGDLPAPEELLVSPVVEMAQMPVVEEPPPPMPEETVTEKIAPMEMVKTEPVSLPEVSAAEQAIVESDGTNQSRAELAIKEDKLVPVPETGEITSEEAIVRPLPERYMKVQRDRAPADLDSRLTAARSALTQGRYQAALSLFSELAKTYPGDTRIEMGRAVSLQQMGMMDDALSSYEAVLRKDPKNLEALTNMLGLLKNQNPELALSRLKELRTTYPANADITAQLGVAHGTAGNYEEALKYLDIAQSLGSDRMHISYNKAVVYDMMGQSVHAAGLYREVLSTASARQHNGGLPLQAIRDRLAVLR